MGALFEDRERMRMLLRTGADMALSRSDAERMIVMGYCFGGAATLEMARNDGLDAVQGYATFHGGLSTPEGQGYDGDEAPLLILHGGADSSITLDDVATLGTELEAAGTPYRIEIYSGAPHAFTVFDGDRYDERADTASWSAFTAFLEDRLAD
jgi:dienelactone hydrolase